MGVFALSPVSAAALILFVLFVKFAVRLVYVRRMARGLPGPPHHWLWGHLGVAIKMSRAVPTDVFPNIYWQWISETYHLEDVFYFDTWPLGPPLMIVLNANMADQMTVEHSLPKHPIVHSYLRRFLGRDNLVSANGMEWRKARDLFSPGFALSNLMKSVPYLLGSALEYRSVLEDQVVNGDVFSMEEVAMKLTFEFIGRIALGQDLNVQRGDNDYLATIRTQLEHMPKSIFYAAVEQLDYLKQFSLSRAVKKINNYLSDEIDNKVSQIFAPPYAQKQGDPSLLRLGLDMYFAGKKQRDLALQPCVDNNHKNLMMDQIKAFMFAGYDTTSTTISNLNYLLSKNPNAKQRIMTELHDVFGPDNPSTMADMIRQDPYVLNRLSYCLAAIKETLRIFPPAGTNRIGEKGCYLRDPSGNLLPTEGWLVWPAVYSMSRNPNYYAEPDLFVPERFLPDESPFPPIPNGAFRPFERGPRSCIGKDIGMLQIKLSLIFTVRRFDFQDAYPENATRINGHPCYQIMWGSAKPKNAMPMKVRMREEL